MIRALLLFFLCTNSFSQVPVVDATGREIRPPPKVERVYAAGPPASMLVFAIAPDKLVGWTRAFRANEAEFVAPKYAALPELGRLTGRGNTANIEVVLKAKTDLIVDVGSTGASFASLATQVQEQTRIPYGLFDGRIESTPATLRALGKLMGDEQRAEQLAVWYEKQLADAKQRVARAGKHPRVYYGRGPAGLQTGGKGSINVEILEFLGAQNVAAEARPGLTAVPIEQILLWNPEVVLTTDPDFWRSSWNDPRWRAVAAVERKQVFLAPHLPFGWFDFPPGANRLLGVWWAGQLLYPETFDIDLRAKVSEFHRLFYHREPTPAQLDALLGEPGVLPKWSGRAAAYVFAAAALVGLTAVAFAVGRYPVSISEIFSVLLGQQVSPNVETVVLQVRGPRVLAALLVGAALAAAGTAYQGMFRNPLVSPDILGVSTGAALGAVLGIFFSLNVVLIQVFAFAGGLLAVAMVYGVGSRLRGHDPLLALVLTGVVIGTLLGSGIALMKYLADPYNQLPAITFWLLGSLAAITPRDLAVAAPLALAGLAPMLLMRWRMNLLALPDDEARALGVDTTRLRIIVVAAATLMTASAVAISGIIGWVGLLIPHAARLLVGPDFGRLLPLAMLLGAGFLLAVDTLCRNIATIEVPPGVLTALIGTPFFLWLFALSRRRW